MEGVSGHMLEGCRRTFRRGCHQAMSPCRLLKKLLEALSDCAPMAAGSSRARRRTSLARLDSTSV